MSTNPTKIRKRSVTIAGHRTSVSLEDAFWRALGDIAAAEGQSLNQLVTAIDARRAPVPTGPPTAGNLSSYLRVHVLQELQRAVNEN